MRADDDQWAEDYDRWTGRDYAGYGKAASVGEAPDAASKAYAGGYWGKNGSDWDAWGRDQDLAIDESYDRTNAKSYGAESYDEWDNQDDDKWGAQAWGMDRDVYGASSYGKKASAGDYDYYGKDGSYGSYGGYGYGKDGGSYGAGYGGKDYGASASYGAAKSGYDNDVWAKQAYGQDYDSRWGKSYDSVDAKSYDNEQYARSVQADDDQWAEDYDRWNNRDYYGRGKAASTQEEKEVEVKPVYGKVGYAGYSGYGAGYGAGYGYGKQSYVAPVYGKVGYEVEEKKEEEKPAPQYNYRW